MFGSSLLQRLVISREDSVLQMTLLRLSTLICSMWHLQQEVVSIHSGMAQLFPLAATNQVLQHGRYILSPITPGEQVSLSNERFYPRTLSLSSTNREIVFRAQVRQCDRRCVITGNQNYEALTIDGLASRLLISFRLHLTKFSIVTDLRTSSDITTHQVSILLKTVFYFAQTFISHGMTIPLRLIQMMAIGSKVFNQARGNTIIRSCILSVGSLAIRNGSLMPFCSGILNRQFYAICVVLVKPHLNLISRLERTWWAKFVKGPKQRKEWKSNCSPACMVGAAHNPQNLRRNLLHTPRRTLSRSYEPSYMMYIHSDQISTRTGNHLPLVIWASPRSSVSDSSESNAPWYDL